MQIVSKQGIKGPDIMVNLVWAITYISEYVMHINLVAITVSNSQAVHASLCVFAPQLASMHWHGIGVKQWFLLQLSTEQRCLLVYLLPGV